MKERTFTVIKPDGVQHSLVGEIIKHFQQKVFHVIAMKLVQASEDLLKEHYIDLKDFILCWPGEVHAIRTYGCHSRGGGRGGAEYGEDRPSDAQGPQPCRL